MACESAVMGGKQTQEKLASLASHRADLRRNITAWGALVWSYADEIVLAASSIGPSRFIGEGPAMSGIGRERIGGGAINGWYEPHADARQIHAKLGDWFSHDGRGAQLVMWHAERRREVPSRIRLPRVKAVPVYDRNGDVLIQRRRSPLSNRLMTEFCVLQFEGLDPAVADRKEREWREFHEMFLAFLDVMAGFQLSKWRITGRGLTSDTESLTR